MSVNGNKMHIGHMNNLAPANNNSLLNNNNNIETSAAGATPSLSKYFPSSEGIVSSGFESHFNTSSPHHHLVSPQMHMNGGESTDKGHDMCRIELIS